MSIVRAFSPATTDSALEASIQKVWSYLVVTSEPSRRIAVTGWDRSDSLAGHLFRKLQADLGITDSTHSIEQNGAAALVFFGGTRLEEFLELVQLGLSALEERAGVRLVVDPRLGVRCTGECIEICCLHATCARGR